MMSKVELPIAVTCQCAISYHVETLPNGSRVHVLDEELPSVMFMCIGRCDKCGLPFHTEFGEGSEQRPFLICLP